VTLGRAIELAVAVGLLAVGVFIYRRPRSDADRTDGYGSQGAVILFIVGAIVAIHALRLMEYRPGSADADMLRSQSQ